MSPEPLVKQLQAHESKYTPSAEIMDQLQQVTMILLIGPFAVGKSTLMEAINNIDSDFKRIRSFTTRRKRPAEESSTYYYLPHSQEALAGILQMVLAGTVAQYKVHPHTKRLYGSYASEYSKPFCMLDTLASGVEGIRQLPFKKLIEVAITAPTDDWLVRYHQRQSGENDTIKRLYEGIDSLQWSLAQPEILWINNANGQLETAAHEILDLARYQKSPSADERKTGQSLLSTLQSLSSKA